MVKAKQGTKTVKDYLENGKIIGVTFKNYYGTDYIVEKIDSAYGKVCLVDTTGNKRQIIQSLDDKFVK